jgi:ureidoglycolate lyase
MPAKVHEPILPREIRAMHAKTLSPPRRLPLERATAENVRPFGVLVGAAADRAPRTGTFYGDAVELWAQDQFRSDADTCLSVSRVHPRPREVIWMERHFKHTQVFVPLGGRPFAMVLGAPTNGGLPDPDSIRALHFDGSGGFMLYLGTWHEFPFALDATTDLLVILRNETNRDLEVRDNDEAEGGDLEKRNLRARLGYGFVF